MGGYFPSIYKIGGNFQILGGPQTSLDHVMKTLFIPLKHFYLYLHEVTILLSCKQISSLNEHGDGLIANSMNQD